VLYPNPASEIVTLEIIESDDLKINSMDKDCIIYLFDKNGRILYNVRTKNRRIDIDVSFLQEGTYYIIAAIGEYKSNVSLSIVR
jgi:hypothetical protein